MGRIMNLPQNRAARFSLSVFCLAAFFLALGCDDSDDSPISDAAFSQDAVLSEDAKPSEDATDSDASTDATTDSDASDASTDSDASDASDASTDSDASDASTDSDGSTDEDASDASTDIDASDASTDIDASDASTDSDASDAIVCPATTFGPDCTPCSCVHGICNNGLNGDGKCLACNDDYFGENCDNNEPTCVEGTPALGPNGDGKCSQCNFGFFGENCENDLVTCMGGTPNLGPSGDGKCAECDPGYFGENCEPCSCKHGTCNDGITGDGKCAECTEPGYFGENCENEVTCKHGQANSGIHGDGKCSTCDDNKRWGGDNCDVCLDGFGESCAICTRPDGIYDQATAEECRLTDSDGQIYQVVKIGDQIWMAENYRRETGSYLHVGAASDTTSDENDKLYGLRYLYETASSEDFCPEGWHLPSMGEFQRLLNYADQHRLRSPNQIEALMAPYHIIVQYPRGLEFVGGYDEFGFGLQPSGSYGTNGYGVPSEQYGYPKSSGFIDWDIATLWLAITNQDFNKNSIAFSFEKKDLKATQWEENEVAFNHYVDRDLQITALSARCLKDTTCGEGTYRLGKSCEPCSCEHGICNDGEEGDGKCLSCDDGWTGENCDLCANGGYGPDCKPYGSVTAPDGDIYKTVEIGHQLWMAENYHRPIGQYRTVGDGSVAAYGLFYDFDTSAASDFCPKGWRIPEVKDLEELLEFVEQNRKSSSNFLALISKTLLWQDYLNEGQDEFGFSALPAGNTRITFSTFNEGEQARFWAMEKTTGSSDSEPQLSPAALIFASGSVTILQGMSTDWSHSVRCMRRICPNNGYFGENCDQAVTCSEHGTPSEGPDGDGHCTECTSGWAGPDCNIEVTCNNEHGTPNEGPNGDGHCSECTSEWAGPDCNIEVTCNSNHGTSSLGPTGNGKCVLGSCVASYGGDNCDLCANGKFGTTCNKTCTRPGGQYNRATPGDCQITDERDGETYQVVQIGDQIWMAENYRRDTGLNFHVPRYTESDLTDAEWDRAFGLRYNYETVTADDFCPAGWHLPSEGEFRQLLAYVEQHKTSGAVSQALIANSPLWKGEPGNDEFGFSAMPAAYNLYDSSYGYMHYGYEGNFAQFWTSALENPELSSVVDLSSSVYAYDLQIHINHSPENEALSVRCIMDHPCSEGQFGKSCRTCPEHCSVCDDGNTGSGKCIACESGYFGPYCDQKVTCNREHGTPNEGPDGNGKCTECTSGWDGPDCDIEIPTCNREHGTLSLDTQGNDKCSACESGWAGPYCNQKVTCNLEHGTPNEGPDGDGKCVSGSCEAPYGGDNCDICMNGKFGAACDKICTRPGGQYDHATAEDCQITDARDGETYQVVQIGDRVWMAENYRRAIGHHYKGKKGWVESYGLFYDFETVTADDFCPEGWRMPKTEEYETLLDYVKQHRTSDSDLLALIAKSPLWVDYPNQGLDEFGFSALPSGLCWGGTVFDDNCGEVFRGLYANFLSVSDPQMKPATFQIDGTNVKIIKHGSTNWINSVRCIQKRFSCPEPGWFGPNCDQEITCNSEHGTADADPEGDGHCSACESGWFGNNCDQKVTCSEHGTANDGPDGDGHCSACESGWFGPDCDQAVTCSAHGTGTPNDGPEGDGHCSACESGYFGDNCDQEEPPCVHGTTDAVLGHCSSCAPGWAGPDCDLKVTCSEHGTPSLGTQGDGKCTSCEQGWYGENCDKEATCVHGTTNDGLYGDGKCSSCEEGYYGEDCNSGTITDQDGNTYRTVTIGTQAWMAENYRRKVGTEDTDYAHVNNSSSNDEEYGLFYSSSIIRSAIRSADFCPAGWHLPSVDEFQTLLDYAEAHRTSETVKQSLLKNQGDEFDFAAQKAGYAYKVTASAPTTYANSNNFVAFWASFSGSVYNKLLYSNNSKDDFTFMDEPVNLSGIYFYSVRCIRDEECPEGTYGLYCNLCKCKHATCDDGPEGNGECTSACEGGWTGTYCDLCPVGGYGELCTTCTRPYGQYDQANAEDCQMTDDDGNVYPVTRIGDQIWMAENMRLETGIYCSDDEWINENEAYGLLYNIQTADEICPDGWHLPSVEEFDQLFAYVAEATGDTTSSPIIANSPLWSEEPNEYRDASGFSAVPTRLTTYLDGSSCIFMEPHPGSEGALFWTSTIQTNLKRKYLSLDSSFHDYYSMDPNAEYPIPGSVRCIMDSPPVTP